MKRLLLCSLALVIMIIAVSCAPSATRRGSTPTTSAPTPAPAAPSAVSSASDRMTVRTADVRLVVENISTTIERITVLAEASGGYVVSSRMFRDGDVLRGDIAIRVPAEAFNRTMGEIDRLAVEVLSRTTGSKDVTEEYTDLGAQLQNLQATEEQLVRIMQKANDIDDVLSVQRELTQVRDRIERTKGRMQLLERTSETSLIQVSLEQSGLRVKITSDRTIVRTGEAVLFGAEATGGFAPYSYQWDFGDNSVGTSKTPRHVYKSSGTYTISLRITDDRSNVNTDRRDNYVTVLPGWSPGNVARAAGHGFIVFGQIFVDIVIWLGIFSPVWLVGGGVWYYVRRRRRKSRLIREGSGPPGAGAEGIGQGVEPDSAKPD